MAEKDVRTKSRSGRLGVLGGMGPLATVCFLQRVVEMTDAVCDQDHLDMLICNAPGIPDRTRYILDRSQENPLPIMTDLGQNLAAQGVCCIAIPCITAHFFFDQLASAISCPLIHAVRETARHLAENGVRRVGLAATDGTLASGLFQAELKREHVTAVLPGPAGQQAVMALIYDDLKAGRPPRLELFKTLTADLHGQGVETIILGCTELSLLKKERLLGPGYLDVIDVLARAAIIACDGRLRPAYDNLISLAE